MVSTLDGFKLSEFDLRMRGPGEIFGIAQSGRREGGLVDLRKDVDRVEEARNEARAILGRDPGLKDPANGNLRRRLESRFGQWMGLASLS